jgi:hypothetical protein
VFDALLDRIDVFLDRIDVTAGFRPAVAGPHRERSR